MEIQLIEFVLWLGFGFTVWALRASLSELEREIALRKTTLTNPGQTPASDSIPQQLTELIGYYLDAPIYRYAVIEGRSYRFDYICVKDQASQLSIDQRWIMPGLAYVACSQMSTD